MPAPAVRRSRLVLLTLALAAGACAAPPAECDEPKISVSLTASTAEAKQCDPVEFTLTITNLSDEEVSVFCPTMWGYTVSPQFRDTATGKVFGSGVKWMGALSRDRVTIAVGGSYRYVLHLQEPFPMPACLGPGSYEVWLSYQSGANGALETNEVPLRIDPLAPDEQREQEAARLAARCGEEKPCAEPAMQFLGRYPNGRFANWVRLELGAQQLTKKQHADAEGLFAAVLADRRATAYEHRRANSQMARSLQDGGQPERALPFLEAIPTCWAKDAAERLRARIERKQKP